MPASSAFRHHVFLPFQLSFGLQDDVDREAKNTRTRKCARRQPASLVGLWSAESLADMRTGSRTLLSLERSEEHTSELQSLMRISYAVFCLKKKNTYTMTNNRGEAGCDTLTYTFTISIYFSLFVFFMFFFHDTATT